MGARCRKATPPKGPPRAHRASSDRWWIAAEARAYAATAQTVTSAIAIGGMRRQVISGDGPCFSRAMLSASAIVRAVR